MGFAKSEVINILAMELAGGLLIAPLFPRFCEKFGVFGVIIASLILRNICLIAFPVAPNMHITMLYFFGFGAGEFCLFAALQYWYTSLLTNESRSTMIGVINVAFRTGIAVGVGLLFTKYSNASAEIFYTSALFASVIILPAFLVKNSMPLTPPKTHYTAPSKIVKYAIIPILCLLVSNYALVALRNFAIVYAIESGVEYNDALMINIYMVTGNLLLTIPISMLLDRLRNKMMPLIVALIIMCVSIAIMPLVINNHYLTIAIFVAISGGVGTIYVIGVSVVSAKFKGDNLATANTVMLMMHSIGGFAGVSITGAAIEYWGNQGMVISISILLLFFLLFVIYSLKHHE